MRALLADPMFVTEAARFSQQIMEHSELSEESESSEEEEDAGSQSK